MACGTAQSPGGGNAAPQNAAPAGHVHGAPPPPPAPLRPGERFVEVGLQRPYQSTPPQGGTDEYRCFLIDPGLTESAYLTGNQVLPQNPAIVHHAIIFKVAQTMVAHAKDVDAQTPGDGWPCFGGIGLTDHDSFAGGERAGGTFITAWGPGGKETLLGNNTGFLFEPGARIVLQVHYNLLSTNGKPGLTDQSKVRLRFAPGTANLTPLKGMLLPAPIELPCPPNESGPLCDRDASVADMIKRTGAQGKTQLDALTTRCFNGNPPVAGVTQSCNNIIKDPVLLYSIAPHMHLLGRSIKVELNPGTPGAQTLLEQKEYNFDDQSAILLPQPVQLKANDNIRVTCTHDAKLREQLPELQTLKPRYVVWGDGTSDEMCLAILTTAIVKS